MNIKQLSKKLNLSITTVSRALGVYSDVNQKTKERVKKYAKKYKYSPNLNASRLASNKSKTVGFVFPLYGLNSNQLNQTSFFEFISGMSKKLNKKIGKDISIVTFDGPVVERITTPALTAVDHSRDELGIKAIEILLSMDDNNYKHQYFLAKPRLIDRGTIHRVLK